MTAPDELVAALAPELRSWLAQQRWFAGKGREIGEVTPELARWLDDQRHDLLQAVVLVDGERYQLILGTGTNLPDYLRQTVIGEVDGRSVYDATHDPSLAARLLELVDTEPGVELASDLRARLIGVEQSNTSIVFGHDYILKLFRRPLAGENRDVALHRALAAVGSTHIAAPLGTIDEAGLMLGFLQQFLPDAVDGWAMATASVRDLLAEPGVQAADAGGDFAGEAGRLGAAVASVHADLATALVGDTAGRDELAAEAAGMSARLRAVVARLPALEEFAGSVASTFEAITELDEPVVRQHIHGDLHLGQTLRGTTGWVLIDFEGEPAADPARRLLPGSPLRDVAGMLRSFDYAAFQLVHGSSDADQVTRAGEWAERNRDAFCTGYASVAAADPREHATLLRAYELDKAVYEIGYELDHRPDWVNIPLGGIARYADPV